jgi:hypothetical protein
LAEHVDAPLALEVAQPPEREQGGADGDQVSHGHPFLSVAIKAPVGWPMLGRAILMTLVSKADMKVPEPTTARVHHFTAAGSARLQGFTPGWSLSSFRMVSVSSIRSTFLSR